MALFARKTSRFFAFEHFPSFLKENLEQHMRRMIFTADSPLIPSRYITGSCGQKETCTQMEPKRRMSLGPRKPLTRIHI